MKSEQAIETQPPSLNRVLIPVFLIVMTDVVGFGIMVPLLPFYAMHTGASAFEVGLLLSVYSLCQLLAGSPLGQWSDRIGRRPVLLISQLGTIAGYVLLALSQQLWLIFLARIIDGLTAGNISVAQAYVSDNTSRDKRTKAFGIVGAAFGLGMLLGPTLGGLLARRSLQTPIWAAAALSALSLVATATLLPKGKPVARQGPKQDFLPFRAMRNFYTDATTGGLFVLLTCFYFAFALFVSGFALFLAAKVTLHGQRVGPQSVGLLFAYAGLINLFLQAFLLERIIKLCSERKLLVAGFLLMAGGYAGLSLCHTVTITLAFLTLNNVGGAVLRPVITSQISKRTAPERQGLAMGVTQSVMAATSIAAPLLSGLLIQGGYYKSWALSASLVAFFGAWGSVRMRSSMAEQRTIAI